jgi:hypothetical protein
MTHEVFELFMTTMMAHPTSASFGSVKRCDKYKSSDLDERKSNIKNCQGYGGRLWVALVALNGSMSNLDRYSQCTFHFGVGVGGGSADERRESD